MRIIYNICVYIEGGLSLSMYIYEKVICEGTHVLDWRLGPGSPSVGDGAGLSEMRRSTIWVATLDPLRGPGTKHTISRNTLPNS